MNQMAVEVPVLTFSGNENSRSSLALVFCKNNNIELKSIIDVVINERIESKAMESKFKTEVEKNSLLMNCLSFLLII